LQAFPPIVAPPKVSLKSAPAPKFSLKEWVPSQGYSNARLRGILDKAASAMEGERNKMVFWCANRIREMAAEGELDQGEFAQACGKLIQASTSTGLSAQEAQRTIASAMR
jgi:hypothetical protein